MFGLAQNGANAYAKVGVETGVVSATPHKLITMLFNGALTALANALQLMKAESNVIESIAAKGEAISKAISIIESGLRSSLDKSAGGEIAQNLDALYEYMCQRLLLANATNNAVLVTEVQGLLSDLRSSWEAIDPLALPQADMPAPQQDPLAPATPRIVKA